MIIRRRRRYRRIVLIVLMAGLLLKRHFKAFAQTLGATLSVQYQREDDERANALHRRYITPIPSIPQPLQPLHGSAALIAPSPQRPGMSLRRALAAIFTAFAS